MKVTFTGDLCVTGAFLDNLNTGKALVSNELLNQFKSSDYAVSNLEGPATDSIQTYGENPIKLKNPKSSISYLSKHYINVFNLANNHILDYGAMGLRETLEELKTYKCCFFGIENPDEEGFATKILNKNGTKVALIGFTVKSVKSINTTRIATTRDLRQIKKQIQKLKDKCHYVILNYHGGEEFTEFPSPVKRRFLHKLTRIEGVDSIICHHSHTLQGFEKINDTLIFHSIGNFIFDIPAHHPYAYTNQSALLELRFSTDSISFRYIPIQMTNGMVSIHSSHENQQRLNSLCDFTNYKSKWRAEAYRVLFRKNLIQTKIIQASNHSESLQNKNLLQLLWSKKFYKKAYSVLKDNNYRSLYFSAIIHKITHKI